MYSATGDGTELIIAFQGGYVTYDSGYFRNVAIIDVTEVGDGNLTDTQLKSKYSTLKYFEGTKGNPAGTGYDIEADGTVIDNGTSTSYTQSGLTPNTEHIYRIRAKNAYGTSEWTTYAAVMTTLNTTYTLPIISGNTYDIPLSISDENDFSGRTFILTYDASALELLDLSSLTYDRETTEGAIAGTGITITNVSDGSIMMTIDRSIPDNKKWSGLINAVEFKAKMTGKTKIAVD